jgi:hypothetical protein
MKRYKPYYNWLTSLVLYELLADNASRNVANLLNAVRPFNPLVASSNLARPTTNTIACRDAGFFIFSKCQQSVNRDKGLRVLASCR